MYLSDQNGHNIEREKKVEHFSKQAQTEQQKNPKLVTDQKY